MCRVPRHLPQSVSLSARAARKLGHARISLFLLQTGCLLGAGFGRLCHHHSSPIPLSLRLQTGQQASLDGRPVCLGPSLGRWRCCGNRRICSIHGPRHHKYSSWRRYNQKLKILDFFIIIASLSADRPLFQTEYIVCVWTFMTFKWSITSYYYSIKTYKNLMIENSLIFLQVLFPKSELLAGC